MQTGITTAVLKGANAPVAKDQNGETVGAEATTLRMEGDPHCNAPSVSYTHYCPSGEVVCRGESG